MPLKNSGDIFINQDGGFNGKIADLLYVNSAVSASEIAMIYNSGHKDSTDKGEPLTHSQPNHEVSELFKKIAENIKVSLFNP